MVENEKQQANSRRAMSAFDLLQLAGGVNQEFVFVSLEEQLEKAMAEIAESFHLGHSKRKISIKLEFDNDAGVVLVDSVLKLAPIKPEHPYQKYRSKAISMGKSFYSAEYEQLPLPLDEPNELKGAVLNLVKPLGGTDGISLTTQANGIKLVNEETGNSISIGYGQTETSA